jgi:zinc and cadmium transporter
VSTLSHIVLFTFLGGALSALVAAGFLAVPERARTRALPSLVAFATGALLAAALLGLLPEAIERAPVGEGAHVVGLAVLAGIALFFILEKLVLWRHCHEDHCETHAPDPPARLHHHGDAPGHHHDHVRRRSAAALILIGDGVHNLLDGVLIAAAFLTDTNLGIMVGIAVMAHEIPSEVGDFAVLLHGGMSRARALLANVAVSLTSIVGGVIGYFALSRVEQYLPQALAIAAASLLYVAVADLIPGLHRRVDPRTSLLQVLLMAAGVLTVVAVGHLVPH